MQRLDHKSQLSMDKKIIPSAIGCAGAIVPPTDERITRRAQKSAHSTRLVIVIDRQGASANIEFSTNSADTVLFAHHFIEVLDRNVVFSFQCAITCDPSICRACATRSFGCTEKGNPFYVHFGRSVLPFSGRILPGLVIRARSDIALLFGFWLLLIASISCSAFRSICPVSVSGVYTVFTPRVVSSGSVASSGKFNQRFLAAALRTKLGYNVFGQGVNLHRLGFVLARLVRGCQPSCEPLTF